MDGSEIRGSSNASVIVKYGTYTGLATFTVWMPEYPLEIDVDDNRLSQIKGTVCIAYISLAIVHIGSLSTTADASKTKKWMGMPRD